MQGLILNDCEPLIVSSWVRKTPTKNRLNRRNMVLNWREAMRFPYAGLFILMQNNVVLPTGLVHDTMKMLDGYDAITYPVIALRDIQHGIVFMKENVAREVPIEFLEERRCPLCQWMRKLYEANYKVLHMKKPVLQKAERFEVKKEDIQ